MYVSKHSLNEMVVTYPRYCISHKKKKHRKKSRIHKCMITELETLRFIFSTLLEVYFFSDWEGLSITLNKYVFDRDSYYIVLFHVYPQIKDILPFSVNIRTENASVHVKHSCSFSALQTICFTHIQMKNKFSLLPLLLPVNT